MPSEFGEKRPRSPTNIPPAPLHPPPNQLPCPRCKSSNTKFCYYNNYNLSQPRHFCKACRRYWTAGGTLRNVPVGGGTRKNSKRSRSSSITSSTPKPQPSNPETALPVLTNQTPSDDLNLNVNLPESGSDNLIPLLNTPEEEPEIVGMDRIIGYGSNFGYGLCEIGVGFGGRTYPVLPRMGCDLGDGNHELFDVNGESFLCPGFAILKGLK